MNRGQKNLQELLEIAGPDLVGTRIRRLRERHGFSLRQLAQVSGVSKNTVLRIEQGFPTRVSTLRQLCRCFGLKLSEFLSLDYKDSPIIGLQKSDMLVWYDMDHFKGEEIPPEEKFQSADERKVLGLQGHTSFVPLKSRVEGDFFHPNFIELYGSTPRRSHPGMEFCFVHAGEVMVHFETQSVHLKCNESISFHATEVHYYEAVGVHRPAQILSIVIYFGEGVKGKESHWGWVQKRGKLMNG